MEDYALMEKEYVMRPWMCQADVRVNIVDRAEGIYFWDKAGKNILIFPPNL